MSTGNKIKLAIIALGILLAIIMIAQNMQVVRAQFLFFPIEMPMALWLILTLLIGVVLGVLGTWFYAERRRKRNG